DRSTSAAASPSTVRTASPTTRPRTGASGSACPPWTSSGTTTSCRWAWRCGSTRSATHLQAAVGRSEALTGLEVEAPPVQGAHGVVALDLAEHAEVGAPVGARAFDEVVAEPDLLARHAAAIGIELAQRLGLGAAHPLDRQRLEEVVEVLVE